MSQHPRWKLQGFIALCKIAKESYTNQHVRNNSSNMEKKKKKSQVRGGGEVAETLSDGKKRCGKRTGRTGGGGNESIILPVVFS